MIGKNRPPSRNAGENALSASRKSREEVRFYKSFSDKQICIDCYLIYLARTSGGKCADIYEVICFVAVVNINLLIIDYIFSESIKAVDYAMNTVVIKCHTAMAQAACEVFDSLKWDGVVGTIAGENTIFILMRTEDMAHKLNDKLKQYIK